MIELSWLLATKLSKVQYACFAKEKHSKRGKREVQNERSEGERKAFHKLLILNHWIFALWFFGFWEFLSIWPFYLQKVSKHAVCSVVCMFSL